MTINYGKRYGGLLTASSPGDMLYIPLNFYNDSGASISIGNTLAVTDIEVFKNGGVTQRATDSGYAILGDTGNFDNRIGFKGISISLFNTADDPSFYAAGNMYWVAIDSVTVDARTVRFFPAVFEIGEPRANLVQINADTGAASNLGQNLATAPTYWQQVDVQKMDADTGAANVLMQFAATSGTLSPTGELDTGSVANSSYLPANVTRWLGTAAASPTVAGVPKVEVTSFADTGVNNRLSVIAADTDTGIQSSVNVTSFADTGVNERLGVIESHTDTGIQTNMSANVTKVAGTTIGGSGTSTNPWGPA